MKKIHLALFLFFSWAISSAHEPPIIINLADAIKAVKNYHTSDQYFKDIDRAIDDGLANLRQFNIPPNAAFVFDVDETALSNLEYELQYNFCFDPATWDQWVNKGKAPAIPGVKRFYDSLRARNISIIFITGRSPEQYEITLKNLKNEGFLHIDTLICKPLEFKGKKTVEFKSAIRRQLSKKYTIIGTIGDQWSDLEGGWTIIKIKLPNYMYFLE